MTASPVWFGPPARRLFGWFHAPEDGTARQGVVVCPPLGLDYMQAHYALRLLSERLEQLGLCVVRLDYDGTGDSVGDAADPDRVASWIGSVARAVELVRSTGVEAVSLVGMRLGAALAAKAAAEDGAVRQLVLWDPCLSGRVYLAEQRAMMSLSLGVAPPEDGSVETPGILHDPQTVRDLSGLNVARLPGPLADRALVLVRSDRAVEVGAHAHLASEPVEWGEATGQAELMDVGSPFQVLPRVAIERIATWLASGSAEERTPVRVPVSPSSAVVGVDTTGRPVRERTCFFGPAGLFGVLCEVDGADGDLTVLLPSVAQEHHVGPSRMWVEISRRLASQGIRSLRFDLSGLGESPRRSGDQPEWVSHAPEAFEDVVDAAHAASPVDPSAVVLVGLCAAAYQAIESAFDLAPRGVVAINPIFAFVPPEDKLGLDLRPVRRVAMPLSPVVKVFRDDRALGWLRRRFPDLGWRVRTLASRSRRPGVWLRRLTGDGVDVLLVCGEREARPIVQGTTRRSVERMTASGRLHFVHHQGLDHGLLASTARQFVAELVCAHVAGELAAHPSPSTDATLVTTR